MLETARLLLRKFEREDSDECFRSWGQDQKLGKYIAGYPMYDISQMEALISSLSENENAWEIIKKESHSIIGMITVDIPYAQLGIGEIGYLIGEKYQNNGYAIESVGCIVQEYIVNRRLYMIEAKYNECNAVSGNLLKKLGFQQDGKLRNRRINSENGERNDLIVCSVTLSEIEKN